VDCDTLKQNASAAGIAVEDYDPNNPPRKGDVIIYDRGEKQHAVTADGNGGYWGNSSSQGKVVHGSDYNEMGGKIPTQVIRTGQLGGSGSGGYTKRKYSEAQLNAIWKQYEAQLIDHNQAEAYQKSERVKSYIDGAKGMTSQSDVVAYMDRVKADPSISIDDYNKIAGSVFGYYGLTRQGKEKGTGGSRTSKKVQGNSGETYTRAQIKKAQSTMTRYWNDDNISDAEQERYNNAAEILQDVGLYGKGDNLNNPKAFTVAREAWDATQDYEKAHKYLRDIYGFSYNEATYYLDNME
jgi:hypothetical protein